MAYDPFWNNVTWLSPLEEHVNSVAKGNIVATNNAVTFTNTIPDPFGTTRKIAFFNGTSSFFRFGLDLTGNIDFTIEGYFALQDGGHGSQYSRIFHLGSGNVQGVIDLVSWMGGGAVANTIWTPSESIIGGTASLPDFAWQYFAVVKTGSKYSFWVNKQLVGTLTTTQLITQSYITFGANGTGSEVWKGYLSNIRITRGIARDVIGADTTRPWPIGNMPIAAGDPYYDKTVLLLRGDSFTDESYAKSAVGVMGNSTAGAAPKVTSGHGTATQTGSALNINNAPLNTENQNTVHIQSKDLQSLGTEDFTIEFSAYTTAWSSTGHATILSCGARELLANENMYSWGVHLHPLGSELAGYHSISVGTYWDSTAVYAFGHIVWNMNTWYHITIIRRVGVVYIYNGTTLLGTSNNLNGIALRNTSTFCCKLFGAGITQGVSATNYHGTSGWIANLRVTKAARPAPATALFPYFPTSVKTIYGTIVESETITDWKITAVSPTGKCAIAYTDTSAWSLALPSTETYDITCSPKVDSTWLPNTNYGVGHLLLAQRDGVTPVIYKCITAGVTGTVSPSFTSNPTIDLAVTWEFVSVAPESKTILAQTFS